MEILAKKYIKICEENNNPSPIWQIRALKSNRNIKEGIIR